MFLAAAATAVVAQDDEALRSLMQRLAAVPEREVRFVEEKRLALLDVPLIQEGTLRYRRPDYLERRVGGRRSVIDGASVVMEHDGERRELDLDDVPLLRAMVAAFRATLAGDLTALRRHYDLEFDGNVDGAWRIELVPRLPRLRDFVERIVIEGQAEHLRRLSVHEANGDLSVTEFFGTDP